MRSKRCKLGVLGAFGVILAVMLGFSGTASATYPGSNGVIAYTGASAGTNYSARSIWAVNPNGTGGRQLVTPSSGGQFLSWPAWSPDGRLVAYSGEHFAYGIWVANTDGSDPRQLPTTAATDHGPAFSPSGGRIAFDRRGVIVSMRLDGSGLRQLAASGHSAQPTYSPDGKWIAYTHRTGDNSAIFVMHRNGSDKRRIARTGLELNGDPASADWSPDGTHIASPSASGLVVARADGSQQRTVVDGPTFSPSYAPNGRRIAFIGEIGPGAWGLKTVRIDGTGLQRVRGAGGYAPSALAWQPVP
jgi:TolB protein